MMVNMWPSTADLLYNARMLSTRTVTALGVFAGFYVASKILSVIISRLVHDDGENSDLLLLLARTAKIAIQIFGAVTALGTAGIDVSALVAGLGLTGFALGFAFRDVLSNVLAGVLILMYRPFRKGDRIAVSGLEGTVSAIDLRYTILAGEDTRILIPNSNLFTNPIVVTPGAGQRAVE